MNKNKTPIWGIVLIVLGIFVALRSLGFFDVNFFFWVSLVILIPCFIGFFSNRNGRSGYLAGILVGVLFMLLSLNIIRWSMFAPLCVAAIFLSIGIKMIIKGGKEPDWSQGPYDNGAQNGSNGTYYGSYDANTDSSQSYENAAEYVKYDANGEIINGYTGAEDAQKTESAQNTQGSYQGGVYGNQESFSGQQNSNFTSSNGVPYGYQAYSAVMSSRVISFDNEKFPGAMLSAVMGAITLNLRNSIITEDVRVDVKSTMAGIDILVPKNIRVVVNCTPILGGIDNKTVSPAGMINCPTIFINATCVLGGIDVKY